MTRIYSTLGALALGGLLTMLPLQGPASAGQQAVEAEQTRTGDEATNWREEYAYSMGVAAMHYAYPYWRMAHVRYGLTMVDVQAPASAVVPNRMLNKIWHSKMLVSPEWKIGGAPNNDTLFSGSWIHVAEEPVVLSIPPIDRFYTFEFSGFDSDNFAYVSELKHGRDGGSYALLPQGWKGKLPDGVKAVAEVPTPWVLMTGRMYVGGQEDLPAVHALQEKVSLVPLSQVSKSNPVIPEPSVLKPFDDSHEVITDPMAVWKTINHALTENPPAGGKAMALRMFREINIGPGLDVEAVDEATKRGLSRAAVDAFEQIKAAQLENAGSAAVNTNNWVYFRNMGHSGSDGDFFARSVWQSYTGIIANDPEEAMYLAAWVDSRNQPLNGANKYRIEMPKGAEPQAGAFWSITLYDADNNLVSNPIKRYSIGDRTKGLVRNARGGLDIVLQRERPSDPKVNWLPVPEAGYGLVMRIYQPSEVHLKDEWLAPRVEYVK